MTTEDEATAVAVPIAQMVRTPPEQNPNKMSREAFALLVEALRGDFNQPVLLARLGSAPDGSPRYDVVDGNHRITAAEQVGYEALPAVVRDYTPEQVKAYRLGMNRLRGEVDLGIARGIVQDLVGDGWSVADLVVTGFAADEIAELAALSGKPLDEDLLAAAGATETSDAPGVAAKPFVLEIPFVDKKEYQLAKRKLLKAAGATRDLSRGLLSVLGEEG